MTVDYQLHSRQTYQSHIQLQQENNHLHNKQSKTVYRSNRGYVYCRDSLRRKKISKADGYQGDTVHINLAEKKPEQS